MRAAPRSTAIIIFLDEERFLREAVESVFNQTADDWELLLVDDGSRDGSPDIAAGFVRSAPHQVRLLQHPRHENRGMSASRNLGLSHARGEFIGFLDADDLWVPTKLTEQQERFDREPDIGLLYGRTLIWHQWNPAAAAEDFLYPLGVEPDRTYAPPALFEVLLANKAQTPTTCNAMMRSALIERIGGFEEAFRGMFEDQVFFAKALLAAPAHVADRVWAKYRQHDDSHSFVAERTRSVSKSRITYLQWLDAYARRVGVAEAGLRAITRETATARRAVWADRLSRVFGLAR